MNLSLKMIWETLNKSNRRRGLMIGVFRLKKILMRVEYPQELFSAVDLLSLQFLGAFCTQRKVSMVSFGRISPNRFLSSILLVVVIIITVVIVVVILVVVIFAIVEVVIIVVVFGVVVVVDGVSLIFKFSFMIIGWAYAFHQDKASSVKVPVANVTLFSQHICFERILIRFPFFRLVFALDDLIDEDMRSLDLDSLLEVLNDDPFSQFSPKKQINNVESVKTSIEEPPDLELKDLPAHLEYAFLEKDNKLPVIISKDLKDDEKVKLIEVLKAHKSALAWKISDIKGLCTGLNFYYTTTEKEMLAVVYALEKFRPYLVLSRTIVYTDHSAIKYLMAKQDAKSRKNPTKNELEKQHITESFPLESLGRFESVKEINVNENVVNENEKVVENVVLNNMNVLSDNTTPWFADLANYHAGNFVKKGMSSQIKREQIFKMQNTTLGVPYLFKILCGPVIRRVFFGREAMRILMVVIVDPRDGIPSANYTARLSL
ncbi:reverse transcriptase domain-containing protein [Tanacetum coccineum]